MKGTNIRINKKRTLSFLRLEGRWKVYKKLKNFFPVKREIYRIDVIVLDLSNKERRILSKKSRERILGYWGNMKYLEINIKLV